MKIMYLGDSIEILERLERSFDLIPLNVAKDCNGSPEWPVYKNFPTDIDAIVIGTQIQGSLAIKEALDYARCFSIPFVLCSPLDVYMPFQPLFELYSKDNKIGYLKPSSKTLESLASAIMSVVNMTVPYSLLEFR